MPFFGSLAGDWFDLGVAAAVADLLVVSDPSLDRARGVRGGVFNGGEATLSVSFLFSKQETKADCAEGSCEALADGSGGLDGLWDTGFESSGAGADGVVVTAARGFNPLVNRRLGKGIASLVGKCFPARDRLLLRLLPPDPSSASVCVEDEIDAFDDTGGVRAVGWLLVCAIEVAARRSDSDEMS